MMKNIRDKAHLFETVRMRRLQSQDPVVLGLSGIECAGKSSLAHELGHMFTEAGMKSYVTSVDDFLEPKSIRHAGENVVENYYSRTFRISDLIKQVVLPFKHHGAISSATHHNYDTDELFSQDVSLDGLSILVLEGVFLFRPPLVEHIDVKVWVDIPFEVALQRATARKLDIARYGAEQIAERYQNRYFPAEKRHLDLDDPISKADFVVSAFSLERTA